MIRAGKPCAALAALCFVSMIAGAARSHSQAQPAAASNRVIGTVASVSGNTVSVKTDAGATVAVSVPDTARIVRTAPGSKTLTGATK
ncbi:MAG: hypothetical protein WBX03_04200, partial [Terriglobales bacterium]